MRRTATVVLCAMYKYSYLLTYLLIYLKTETLTYLQHSGYLLAGRFVLYNGSIGLHPRILLSEVSCSASGR